MPASPRRARVRRLLATVLVGTPFLLGAAAADSPHPGELVLTFRDPEILESSGLVALPGTPRRFATVNDSGDSGRVFVVDPDGRTVDVTTWEDDPYDVEALAPAGPGEVWVGDIGDNLRVRDHVVVARVAVGPSTGGTGLLARHELTYPDGPQDAEALLRHPGTGQLFVVTKGVFGGRVLAAPERLRDDAPNPLTTLGQVVGIVTDGAFWPDGRHLVLRTYGAAHVYSFPALEQVGRFDLPAQPQGEGLAVSEEGELFVSTEGQGSDLLRVRVPDELRGVLEAGREADDDGPTSWWRRLLRRLVGPEQLRPV